MLELFCFFLPNLTLSLHAVFLPHVTPCNSPAPPWGGVPHNSRPDAHLETNILCSLILAYWVFHYLSLITQPEPYLGHWDTNPIFSKVKVISFIGPTINRDLLLATFRWLRMSHLQSVNIIQTQNVFSKIHIAWWMEKNNSNSNSYMHLALDLCPLLTAQLHLFSIIFSS